MTQAEADAGVTLTPEALRAFEDLFLDWADQNREELELGGLGDSKALARLSAIWAHTFRPNLLLRHNSAVEERAHNL